MANTGLRVSESFLIVGILLFIDDRRDALKLTPEVYTALVMRKHKITSFAPTLLAWHLGRSAQLALKCH